MRLLCFSLAMVMVFGGPCPAQQERDPSSEKAAKAASRLSSERALADLEHPDPLRRELATRRLIDLGDEVLDAVRARCASEDAALALRARRIHVAIRGVTVEVDHEIRELLKAHQDGDTEALTTAHRMADLGANATEAALGLVDDGKLKSALFVRHALGRIGDGADRDDKAWRAVVAMGKGAVPALRDVLTDDDVARGIRLHALWLYGLNQTDGVADLAPLLAAGDPVLRNEALDLISAGFREDDFAALAAALPAGASHARRRVAASAARHLDLGALERHLRGDDAPAALAALAIGELRTAEATKSLAKRLGSASDPVREAIVTALGAVAHDDAIDPLVRRACEDPRPCVRAAAIAALTNYPKKRVARVAITGALADPALAVRVQATDALVALGGDDVIPSLVHALNHDDEDAVRARAFAGLQILDPRDAEIAASFDGADALSRAAKLWRPGTPEVSEDTAKRLPWHESSRDAARIVRQVRERIESQFFYFDEKELVKTENLDAAALAAVKKLLDSDDDGIETKGAEGIVLRRALATKVTSPEALVTLLGAIPFEEAPRADLIRVTNAAVRGMVGSLGDRFSRISISNDASGRPTPEWLPGLIEGSDKSNGFSVKPEGDSWTIEFVLFDSPAFHAGFRIGDRLIKVGDQLTAGMTRKEIRKLLRSKNDFHILRDGWLRPYAFPLEPVAVENEERLVMSAMLPGDIGYVRLAQFALGSSAKIESALRALESRGMKGLIFDLRNNPGGAVVDAVAISDKFTPEGKTICINVTRDGEDQVMKSSEMTPERNYPLVVLVNGSSASASEMTSGSLQGNARCRVIGTTSYGKGIGQSGGGIRGFASKTALGESRSAYSLTLTMMRYFLPKDRRSIHKVGVVPDRLVRPRDLGGEAFDRMMTALRHEAVRDYVGSLVDDDEDLALELALEPGYDTANFPELPTLVQTLGPALDAEQVRRIVRAELRRRFVREVEGEILGRLLCDLEQDRVLRVALEDVAAQASVDLSSVPEAAVLRR